MTKILEVSSVASAERTSNRQTLLAIIYKDVNLRKSERQSASMFFGAATREIFQKFCSKSFKMMQYRATLNFYTNDHEFFHEESAESAEIPTISDHGLLGFHGLIFMKTKTSKTPLMMSEAFGPRAVLLFCA